MNPLNLVTCPVTVRTLLLLNEYDRKRVFQFIEKIRCNPFSAKSSEKEFAAERFIEDYAVYKNGIKTICFYYMSGNRISSKIDFGDGIVYFNGALWPGGRLSETLIQSCSGKKITDVMDIGIFHDLRWSETQKSQSNIQGPALDIGLTSGPSKKLENLLRKEAQAYKKWISHERIAA